MDIAQLDRERERKFLDPKLSPPWMQTRNRIAFDLLEPRAKSVMIFDVAWGLSRIARYTGHTLKHYSVAQHSVLVAATVTVLLRRPDLALVALLHDAAEAYVGDVSQPVKRAMRAIAAGGMSPYDVLEERVQAAIWKHFDVPLDFVKASKDVIKKADLMMLAAEKRDLMSPPVREWQLTEEASSFTIDPWPAEVAYELYIEQLFGAWHRASGQPIPKLDAVRI